MLTCQDRLARYLQKIFTTSKEGVASHLKKVCQRIRNIWQITARRVNNVSGTSCKLLTSKEKQDISMYLNMASRGLCMCIRDTPKEHCHWITGWACISCWLSMHFLLNQTACPSPESPSVILKVSFQDAAPLNPPHVPGLIPGCCSPKPTLCPSPVTPCPLNPPHVLFLHQLQQHINPKGVVALLSLSARTYKP